MQMQVMDAGSGVGERKERNQNGGAGGNMSNSERGTSNNGADASCSQNSLHSNNSTTAQQNPSQVQMPASQIQSEPVAVAFAQEQTSTASTKATGPVAPPPVSLSPTPLSASNNNNNTATGNAAITASATTTNQLTPAQQQLFWQQTMQALSFLTAQPQQQKQQPNGGVVAGGGPVQAPNALGNLPVAFPAMTTAQQQAFALGTAAGATNPGVFTITPMALPPNNTIVANAAALASNNNNNNRKRSFHGTTTQLGAMNTTKRARIPPTAPSVESSSAYDSTANDTEGPPTKMSEQELKKLTPAQRRRYERNLREQQRSYKISQQIKSLRDVLTESNIPYKPNKYSILVSVSDYIKELQARAIMLDADHNKLLSTIKQTNDMVASGQPLPSSSEDLSAETMASSSTSSSTGKDNLRPASSVSSSDNSCPDFLLVQGIDFKAAFFHCPYALGVCSLDGRILACNPAFEQAMGSNVGEMKDQSLFLYIRDQQIIFEAMSELLKSSSLASETGVETGRDQYWCGKVVSTSNVPLRLSITLTNVADGNPKFFSCSIVTVG